MIGGAIGRAQAPRRAPGSHWLRQYAHPCKGLTGGCTSPAANAALAIPEIQD